MRGVVGRYWIIMMMRFGHRIGGRRRHFIKFVWFGGLCYLVFARRFYQLYHFALHECRTRRMASKRRDEHHRMQARRNCDERATREDQSTQRHRATARVRKNVRRSITVHIAQTDLIDAFAKDRGTFIKVTRVGVCVTRIS